MGAFSGLSIDGVYSEGLFFGETSIVRSIDFLLFRCDNKRSKGKEIEMPASRSFDPTIVTAISLTTLDADSLYYAIVTRQEWMKRNGLVDHADWMQEYQRLADLQSRLEPFVIR